MQISAFNPVQHPAYTKDDPAEKGKSRLNPIEPADPAKNEIEKRQPLQQPNSPEAKQLAELKSRDREVRTHEQAHIAAGGRHITSGAQFQFQRGPDGQLYAVGGEVGIDTSPVPGDPLATLEKAETIRRAALAPAQPSSQDRNVASRATAMAAEARAELLMVNQTEKQNEPETDSESISLKKRIEASGAVASGNSSSTISLFA